MDSQFLFLQILRFLRKFLFRKIDITHHIMMLQNYINIILKSHPGIYDVMWWEENEFRCVATN